MAQPPLPSQEGVLQRILLCKAPQGHEIRLYCDLTLLLSWTKATRFRPLQAITRLPSGVAIMLRTTPPPDGITQVWNFSVLGSKRTSVFGLTADSLYHTMSFRVVIP